jgi:hypothetical protein
MEVEQIWRDKSESAISLVSGKSLPEEKPLSDPVISRPRFLCAVTSGCSEIGDVFFVEGRMY